MTNITVEQIKEIAEQLDCGLQVYYNKHTCEIVCIPDSDEIFLDELPWQEDLNKLESHPEDYIEISDMTPGESFRLMKEFADQVKDAVLKQNLLNALN